MAKVEVRPNESLDQALRRFKRKVEQEGLMKVLRAIRHYEKPSEVRRRKRLKKQRSKK
ncbi:MAG: 30S ribosomal protein S21 [Candidatus Omnitrophica bacterium]|nr:30S ribosomal protein S21 [Candidatus Omnitrophota bacterium]